jgi:hypothetical protein
MVLKRGWKALTLVLVMAVPGLAVTQQWANAAGAPKAEWRANKGGKAAPKVKKAAAPEAPPAALPSEPQSGVANPPVSAASVPDQSLEVLDIDTAMAAAIAAQGPKIGYTSVLSEEGILYDANGASPVGLEAANSRFGNFPADVKLIRTPEKALAAGGSGSSWGTYMIKRGETVLSAGRYISVWRREVAGWKMISELAAGKAPAPTSAAPASGVLPKRPAQLGRAAPAAVGVPLTVPTLSPSPTPEPTPQVP